MSIKSLFSGFPIAIALAAPALLATGHAQDAGAHLAMACSSCHGLDGRGGSAIPGLAARDETELLELMRTLQEPADDARGLILEVEEENVVAAVQLLDGEDHCEPRLARLGLRRDGAHAPRVEHAHPVGASPDSGRRGLVGAVHERGQILPAPGSATVLRGFLAGSPSAHDSALALGWCVAIAGLSAIWAVRLYQRKVTG